MDIFTSFPNAVVYRTWQIGQKVRSTEVGTSFENLGYISCIVDEVSSGGQENAPSADFINSNTLLYVRPNELPTVDSAALIANYLIFNAETNKYYTISEVGVGKNQETGEIEHLELILLPTEVINE